MELYGDVIAVSFYNFVIRNIKMAEEGKGKRENLKDDQFFDIVNVQ